MKQQRNNIMEDFLIQYGNVEEERFVTQNLAIATQVYEMLEDRGWSQKTLAEKLGKTPAEVSRWLSGTHNLTLRTIARMEVVFGKEIIITPTRAAQEYQRIQYITFKVHANVNKIIPQATEYSQQPLRAKQTKVVKIPRVA